MWQPSLQVGGQTQLLLVFTSYQVQFSSVLAQSAVMRHFATLALITGPVIATERERERVQGQTAGSHQSWSMTAATRRGEHCSSSVINCTLSTRAPVKFSRRFTWGSSASKLMLKADWLRGKGSLEF